MHAVISTSTLFGAANPTARWGVHFAFVMRFLAGRDDIAALPLATKYFSKPGALNALQAEMSHAASIDAATLVLHDALGLGTLTAAQQIRLKVMARALIEQRLQHLQVTIATQQAQATQMARLLT